MSARPSDLLRLKAIVECIDGINETIAGYEMTREQYVAPVDLDQRTRQRAIDHYMTQLCEEAREVTDETRSKMNQIPWGAIAEMRTYLVHVYEALSADVMWETIITDLKPLRDACEDCIFLIEAGEYAPSFHSRAAERKGSD